MGSVQDPTLITVRFENISPRIAFDIGLVVSQGCSLGLDAKIIYMSRPQDLPSVCSHNYEIQIGMSTGPTERGNLNTFGKSRKP